MTHAKLIRRIAGLAIGAALAATPGIAAADTLDFQISIDGYDLFPIAGNGAKAVSEPGDIAIAIGAGSQAFAGAETGDVGDFSYANGEDALAGSGVGNFDTAIANGASSYAAVGGSENTLSNYDYGSAFGTDSYVEAGSNGGVAASNDSATVFDPFGTVGSEAEALNGTYNFADVFGDNSSALAGFGGNFDLAAVFGDMLHSTAATGGNYLVDILPSL